MGKKESVLLPVKTYACCRRMCIRVPVVTIHVRYRDESLLLPEQLLPTISYVASLHDIGKVHPDFQIRDNGDEENYKKRLGYKRIGLIPHGFRHEAYGADLLKNRIFKKRGLDRKSAKLLSSVIGLHHQGKDQDKQKTFLSLPSPWIEIQDDLECRMYDLFKPSLNQIDLDNHDALGVLLTSILILSDWVASSTEFGCGGISAESDTSLFSALRVKAHEYLRAACLVDDHVSSFPRENVFSKL